MCVDFWRMFVKGVEKGYLKYLEIRGIGYRAALQDQTLMLKLGFSHDVAYTLPPSLKAFLPDQTTVGIYGIDKNQVCLMTVHDAQCKPESSKGIIYLRWIEGSTQHIWMPYFWRFRHSGKQCQNKRLSHVLCSALYRKSAWLVLEASSSSMLLSICISSKGPEPCWQSVSFLRCKFSVLILAGDSGCCQDKSFEATFNLQRQRNTLQGRGCEAQVRKEEVD